MKPFLNVLPVGGKPAVVPALITTGARVRAVLVSGDWCTRRAIAEVTGLSDAVVNTQLQDGIARGTVAREVPQMVRRQRGVTQRYRLSVSR